MIAKVFPGSKSSFSDEVEHPWVFHKFKHLPLGFWKEKQNQLDFIKYLASELHIQTQEDWYKVTPLHVFEHQGEGFLQQFGYSLIKALTGALFTIQFNLLETLPDYNWDLSKFSQVRSELREKFDRFGKQLNVSTLDDWYNIPQQEVIVTCILQKVIRIG